MFFADLLMNLVITFGFITNLPKTFLVNLIVSFGDPITDTIGGVRMAKEGTGGIQITTLLTKHLFGYLVGLGASTIITILRKED